MSVRAGVRQARQQAGGDPRWLRTWFWPAWLAVVAVSFAVAEAWAIVHRGQGGTLSERTRAWLGIRPERKRARLAWGTLASVLVLFVVWFVPHLQQWWPWEA